MRMLLTLIHGVIEVVDVLLLAVRRYAGGISCIMGRQISPEKPKVSLSLFPVSGTQKVLRLCASATKAFGRVSRGWCVQPSTILQLYKYYLPGHLPCTWADYRTRQQP